MSRAWGDSGYYHDRGQSRHGEPWLENRLDGKDRTRYEDWRDAKLNDPRRKKNRDNCTAEKRKTCDQIQGKLCTGDCPSEEGNISNG